MRVAYCFVGHSRTYRKTYRNFFDNVFDMAPGDIFIHTWSETSNTTPAWWHAELTENERALAASPVDPEDLRRIYHPREILIEPQRSLVPVPARIALPYPAYTVKVVYESVQKAFNMAKTHGPYDRIFMTRMDLNYTSPLDPKEFESPLLHVPPMKYLLVNMKCASDLFIHGTQDDVQKSVDYFWEIDSRFLTNPNLELFHEQAWYGYMKDQGVKMAVSKLDFETIRMFTGHRQIWEKHYELPGAAT